MPADEASTEAAVHAPANDADVESDADAGMAAATWALLDDYFGGDRSQLTKHQIDSYNDFVVRKLEQIIEGFNPIDMHHQYVPERARFKYVLSIAVENPTLAKPTITEKDGSTKLMMPNDARLRNMTYAAALHVDVAITARTLDADTGEYASETRRISGVCLGRVPVMVRSRYCMLSQRCAAVAQADECRKDYGGYFIINGNEKVRRGCRPPVAPLPSGLHVGLCVGRCASLCVAVNRAAPGTPRHQARAGPVAGCHEA